MLKDEYSQFIMCTFSLTERGFMLAIGLSKNVMHTDLCQCSLTVSEEMLFQFILFPNGFDLSLRHKICQPNLQLWRTLIEIVISLFTCLFVDMNFFLNLLKPKIVLQTGNQRSHSL